MTSLDTQLTTFEDQYVPQINLTLAELSKWVDQQTLADSMTYSVEAGGKRLRPLLTLAILQLYHVPIDSPRLHATAALELLHTYSLIHDDLPAMDNDDLRRGKPTNHVQFGAGMATLAGDGLLTLAFEWLSTVNLPVKQRLQLVQALSRAAGPAGMVAGQATDIENEHQHLSFAQLQKLHLQKTGALIHYAVEAGCVMADVPKQDRSYLLSFADQFGLAFQIYDDLMDVTASTAKMGKRTHKDAQEAKNTYPSLFGVDGTKAKLLQVVDGAKRSLVSLNASNRVDTQLLVAFCSYFQVKD